MSIRVSTVASGTVASGTVHHQVVVGMSESRCEPVNCTRSFLVEVKHQLILVQFYCYTEVVLFKR